MESKTINFSVNQEFVGLAQVAGGLAMALSWALSAWVLQKGMGNFAVTLYVVASIVVVGYAVMKEE